MAPLKLSNLFRRDPSRQALKERAAATASRTAAFKPTAPETAPAQRAPLAQACDQAVIDWNGIQPASRAKNWGDEQLDQALNAYDAVFQRAIEEPSRDTADVQAKARLLLHDLIAHTTGHDPSDEATLTVDERLTRVVLREIIDLPGEIETSDDDHTATVEEAASLDFTAYTFDTPTRDPNGWMTEFSHHAIGMHIADRTLRMSKPELVDFIRKGGERDADTPAIMLQALDTAQETFEGWGKLLSVARTRYLVAASSAVLDRETPATEPAEPEPATAEQPAPTPNLVAMLDLASATINELQAIQDIAKHVSAVAYAYTWGARCETRRGRYGGIELNGIGKLMHWLGDALTEIESAAELEVSRRVPGTRADRETRLSMCAVTTIDGGDPAAIKAFARELLAHVEAEREGR